CKIKLDYIFIWKIHKNLKHKIVNTPTWYPLWLVAGYHYWDQLNVNLYKELFQQDVAVWLLPLLFLFLGYVIIPVVLYFPKTSLTFWLFEG
ncbi:hypothetical protein R7X80_03735, partial [Mesomycoplasma ovipneumoniae]|nr:hypothetical protein [Mesomycoplasma ovipneumoniae]